MPAMKGLSEGVDLLHFEKYFDGRDHWYHAEIGVNGVRADIEVPACYVEDAAEEEVAQFLERQANVSIERYGDSRDPRPDPALLSETAA